MIKRSYSNTHASFVKADCLPTLLSSSRRIKSTTGMAYVNALVVVSAIDLGTVVETADTFLEPRRQLIPRRKGGCNDWLTSKERRKKRQSRKR